MTVRGLQIALTASVALNVFGIGVATGGLYRWSQVGPSTSAAVSGGRLAAAGNWLLPGPQAAYRRVLRQAMIDDRSTAMAARAARVRAAAAFNAPEFDRTLIQTALDEAKSADFAIRATVEKVVLDFAATLTLDQRLLLAEGLRRDGPLRYLPIPVPPR